MPRKFCGFYDHLYQGDTAVLGHQMDMRSPADLLMEKEDGEGVDAGGDEEGMSLPWVLEVFLEMVFCDELPMDWRFAAKRGLALLRSFSPGLLAGRSLGEEAAFAGLTGRGRFSQDALLEAAAGDEEGLRALLGGLLRWVYQEEGRKWVERGTWRLYVLASHYHGGVLVRWEEAKVVRKRGKLQTSNFNSQGREEEGTLQPGRYRAMGYADFAEAFGEGRDKGARARWCYRAAQILEGLPQVPGATSAEARERMRKKAKGNVNRRGTGRR